MKKIIFSTLAILIAAIAYSQQTQGTVIYQIKDSSRDSWPAGENTFSTSSSSGGGNAAPEITGGSSVIPPKKFKLQFGKNSMTWQKLEDDLTSAGQMFTSSGSSSDADLPNQDDFLFSDLTAKKSIRQTDLAGKQFLVAEPIIPLKWKITDETKVVLNQTCQKATATIVVHKKTMNLDDGKMEMKDIADSNKLIAWFAPNIPISAAPEVQGQLPGLVLELQKETKHTIFVYLAVSLSPKVNLASLKAPIKGKKVSLTQFDTEKVNSQKAIMQGMQSGGIKIMQGNQ